MDQPITDPQSTSGPAPTGTTVAASAPTVEELQAKLAQSEREKQGIFNDLRSEREKRQALERSQPAAASTNGVQPISTAASPRVAVDPVEYIQAREERNKALAWFAKREKLDIEDPEEVLSSPAFRELQEVVNKRHLASMPVYEGMKVAHELLTKEREARAATKAAEEVNRDKTVAAQQTPSAVGAPAQGAKVVKVNSADIGKMTLSEYASMKERAAKNGETIQVE